MMFSTKGRYALRFLIDLAQNCKGNPLALKEVAARQEISVKYLESIAAQLSKAGLVEVQHGKYGGYRLAREPKDYPISEILELTDGSLAPVECVKDGACDCERVKTCRTHPLWRELNDLIYGFLSQKTLADLLEKDA